MLNPLSVHKGNKFDWLLWGSITLLAYAVRVFLRLVWHINFQVDDLPTVLWQCPQSLSAPHLFRWLIRDRGLPLGA